MAGTVRVVVVGVCATGKSLLVRALAESGYDAHECAQEHSYVPTMWEKRCYPDILIYLDAEVSTLTTRTSSEWSARELREQRRRLRHARANCDLHVHTDTISVEEVRDRALRFLERRAQADEVETSNRRKELE